MENAPSVRYPVGRSAFWRRIVLLVGACAALSMGAWWWAAGFTITHGFAVVLILAGSWVFLWLFWLQIPEGELIWLAGAWAWQAPDAVAHSVSPPRIVLDFQRGLCCMVEVDRKVVWIWLDAAQAPGSWRALRRALYSRAPGHESSRA